MIIHVETPGGEVIASGEVKIFHDGGRVYVHMLTDDPVWAHADTEDEAIEMLAGNLEKVAARIREKKKILDGGR